MLIKIFFNRVVLVAFAFIPFLGDEYLWLTVIGVNWASVYETHALQGTISDF